MKIGKERRVTIKIEIIVSMMMIFHVTIFFIKKYFDYQIYLAVTVLGTKNRFLNTILLRLASQIIVIITITCLIKQNKHISTLMQLAIQVVMVYGPVYGG